MTQSGQTNTHPRRRRELDAMGMLVVVGLVFFHSAQIFYFADFYVKNEPPNIQSVSQLVSTLFVAFAGLWGMPLMFLIAGLAIWYSLRKRTAGQFALERTRRLVVPLVVGTVLLIPPIVYLALKADPTYSETFLQFPPRPQPRRRRCGSLNSFICQANSCHSARSALQCAWELAILPLARRQVFTLFLPIRGPKNGANPKSPLSAGAKC